MFVIGVFAVGTFFLAVCTAPLPCGPWVFLIALLLRADIMAWPLFGGVAEIWDGRMLLEFALYGVW